MNILLQVLLFLLQHTLSLNDVISANEKFSDFRNKCDCYNGRHAPMKEFIKKNQTTVVLYINYTIRRNDLTPNERKLLYGWLIEDVFEPDSELISIVETQLLSEDPIFRENALGWLMKWKPDEYLGTCIQFFLTDKFESNALSAIGRVRLYKPRLFLKYVELWKVSKVGEQRSHAFMKALDKSVERAKFELNRVKDHEK